MSEINLVPTDKQIEDLVASIKNLIDDAKTGASTTTSIDIKNQLYQYSDEAQKLLNGVLSKTGILTQQDVNQIDEQVRKVKQQIMLEKANQSQRRLIFGIVGTIGIVSLLWFITKK
jgi:hypothetical protein